MGEKKQTCRSNNYTPTPAASPPAPVPHLNLNARLYGNRLLLKPTLTRSLTHTHAVHGLQNNSAPWQVIYAAGNTGEAWKFNFMTFPSDK